MFYHNSTTYITGLDISPGSLAPLEALETSWGHPFAVLAYISLASSLVIALQSVYAFYLSSVLARYKDPEIMYDPGLAIPQNGFRISTHIDALGGPAIFAYNVARTLSVFALLGLSVVGLLSDQAKSQEDQRLYLALCLAYAYASALAFCTIATRRKLAAITEEHLMVVLISAFVVFAYRDVWPLMTFTQTPEDGRMGSLLWTQVALLAFAAVFVPLTIPGAYTPLDPQDPHPSPNPEQTASLFSLWTYGFLDHIVALAYRVPQISRDQLPPLADYDHAKILVAKSFPRIDPFSGAKSKRHLFWGLLATFRREYSVMAVVLLLRIACNIMSPIGINQLLKYIENNGEGATVRPWVWIAALFFAPMIGSLAAHRYQFLSGAVQVRIECIITQLVFEHSLRIRMKASTSPDVKDGTSQSDAASSISRTAVDPSEGDTGAMENDETGHASSSSVEGEGSTLLATSQSDEDSNKVMRKAPEIPATEAEEKTAESSSKASNMIGKINNLASTDLDNITNGRGFLYVPIYLPIQTAISIWFLYSILGWSAFVSMATLLLLYPIPIYVAKSIHKAQLEKMKMSDERVQTVTETLGVLRMIKLFGWEPKVSERIATNRDKELGWIIRGQMFGLANANLNYIIPALAMVSTFIVHTTVMGKELTASAVFSSIAAFDILKMQLYMVFWLLPQFIRAKVSLDRIGEFLQETELLDEYQNTIQEDQQVGSCTPNEYPAPDQGVIGFRDASFVWSRDSLNDEAGQRSFTLRVEGEVVFKRGSLNLIVGPTGSGKTSLLMALLSEMHFIPLANNSWYNLPRTRGVSYAAQESWVQNETIRDNILFGAPYDEDRYKQVVFQCGLERDLSLFDAGDLTEVGEKGLTLSGGQKARVTLARALYSSAEIILLDDILAALDVHTARWIVDKCLTGPLVKGRTVLLVTHNVAIASPITDHIVSLDLDGRVASRASIEDALAKNKVLSREIAEEVNMIEKGEDDIDAKQLDDVAKASAGKLVVEEEMHEGHVSWAARVMYLSSVGGSWTKSFWPFFLAAMFATHFTMVVQTWILGWWANAYDNHSPNEVDVSYYLTIYMLALLLCLIPYVLGSTAWVFGSMAAARTIHKRLITSILGTTLRWLDKTPTSRIITRCTSDISTIDHALPMHIENWIESTIYMFIRLGAVVVLTPQFLLPGLFIFAAGSWLAQLYIKSQLAVKREMSNAKAPVMGHFGAAIAGLVSIRAYGAQDLFRQESYKRTDRYSRASRTFYSLSRWVCVRIDALAGLFSSGLAAYLVYGPGHTARLASDTGFSLTMAVAFGAIILDWVWVLNDVEIDCNSLERIQSYVAIEQEPKATKEGVPPAYWPASGDLRVENLSARYSTDGPLVLHDISFHIKSGERVGVVGRTGSGKSSLTLSLLRCIYTDGNVYYDGIPTASINLDALRTNITVIPQMPELLSGTLRENLDPFQEYDDATLNSALRASGLFSLQTEDSKNGINLDTKISSGGGNLSVGQKQVLALARAIVRGSKLLILDEATSAIDYQTDSVIQSSLRHELKGDVTLITVAHRLQTIMDADKIMVLDAGRIAEFDTPSVLLKKKDGMLRKLVDESGDKERLYAMVMGDL